MATEATLVSGARYGDEEKQQLAMDEDSDNKNAAAGDEEKPVREKLRDAAISSQHGSQSPSSSDAEPIQYTPPEDDSPNAKQDAPNGRIKLARKRSLEDLKDIESGASNLDAPATPSSGTHARKKSKEQSGGQDQGATKRRPEPTVREEPDSPGTPKSGSDQALEDIAMSPRRKRSAEDMGSDHVRLSKVAATEEAQKARKSLDEDRPTLPATEQVENTTGSDVQKPSSAFTSSKLGGFGNSSSASPFASFGVKPSTVGSSPSPFGTFGSSTTTIAATTTVPPSSLSFATAKSPFASTAGLPSTSAFGGAAAKLSSFASAKGDFAIPPVAGNKLSSFASPSGGDFKPAGLGATGKMTSFSSAGGGNLGGTKPSRPFGAPVVKDDGDGSDTEANTEAEGSDNDEAAEADESKPEEEPGKYQVMEDVATGEEDEDTIFASRAKLYIFNEGWKERGTGIIKLNKKRTPIHDQSEEESGPDEQDEAGGEDDLESGVTQEHKRDNVTAMTKDPKSGSNAATEPDTSSGSPSEARLLMRNMATHRAILNAPLFPNMPIGDPLDLKKAPSGKQMLFLAPDEHGQLSKYLVKIGREDELDKLYGLVKDITDRD